MKRRKHPLLLFKTERHRADNRRCMKRTIVFFTVTLFLFLTGTAFSAPTIPSDDYIESDEVRFGIKTTWLEAELNTLLMLKSELWSDSYGRQFSVSQQKDPSATLVAIEIVPMETVGSRGKWVLYRRLLDGVSERVRIYPVSDPRVFIELRSDGDYPERGKTLLGMSVYGAWACRDIPLGIPFIRTFTSSFASIVSMTPLLVPWTFLDGDSVRYREVISASVIVREGLKSLVYLEDGAFNEKGEPVMILDGSPQKPAELLKALSLGQNPKDVVGGVNCSGFAKWIIDGIVRPRAGSQLFINPLKTQTSSPDTLFTEPYRENRDLFFALDWTRHLASAVVTLNLKKTTLPDFAGIDVTDILLTGVHHYERNVGYRTEELLPILYYLAIRESGNMYLGAISRERGMPLLRQYHHIAAFFPYFDETGQFQVDVYESVVQTPVDAFLVNNTGSYIHLVRVKLPEGPYFQP